MVHTSFGKLLAAYLIVALIALTLPAQGWAMFLPSGPADKMLTADRAAIQKALESAVIKQRLLDYGLTTEEATARINRLSDEQTHELASKIDAVQAGGDAVGALVFLLLVAVLVVVILEVSGHSIIIR